MCTGYVSAFEDELFVVSVLLLCILFCGEHGQRYDCKRSTVGWVRYRMKSNNTNFCDINSDSFYSLTLNTYTENPWPPGDVSDIEQALGQSIPQAPFVSA